MPSAPYAQAKVVEVPLKMNGGCHFGRYSKISDEQTWNLISSDNWMVPYAGYKNVLTLGGSSQGRGLYASYRANLMFAVIGDELWAISETNLDANTPPLVPVGTLFTNTGDVFIAENNNNQICLTDGQYVYIWDYGTSTFSSSNPASVNTFTWPYPDNPPGFVSFQQGYFIIAVTGSTNWILSKFNDGTVWVVSAATVVSLQAKADYIQAVVPVPGKAQNLYVFGRNVVELWQFVENTGLFPYQINASFNIDFGCINPSSIASLNENIIWIAVNEQSGPVLMMSRGTQVESISTDGIDFKLGNLTNPINCTGFLFVQDGHLLYQFTFPDDNLSYAYDFNTKLFFSVSDENLNYHIARQVVYFNDTYYFVALNGPNVYVFDTIYPDAEYASDDIRTIPRIRITPPFSLPDEDYFIVNKLSFTIEQGQPNVVTETTVDVITYDLLAAESGLVLSTEDGEMIGTETVVSDVPAFTYITSENNIYLSLSRDGGATFGSSLTIPMYPTGVRKNKLNVQRLGICNDVTFQWRFVGVSRYVFTDGTAEIYQ